MTDYTITVIEHQSLAALRADAMKLGWWDWSRSDQTSPRRGGGPKDTHRAPQPVPTRRSARRDDSPREPVNLLMRPPCATRASGRLKTLAAADNLSGMVLELKLDLADSVAQEAKARGLLEPPAIERMLRDELQRSRVEELFAAADRLATLDSPPLTEAEVQQEIQAARAQRRGGHASGR